MTFEENANNNNTDVHLLYTIIYAIRFLYEHWTVMILLDFGAYWSQQIIY